MLLGGTEYRRSMAAISQTWGIMAPCGPSPCPFFLVPSSRLWRIILNGLFAFNPHGLRHFLLRFLCLPCFFTLLFLFYFRLTDYQRSYVTRNGLLFNCLAATSFLSTVITVGTFASHRVRYYQETREAIYGGPAFVFSQAIYSLPISCFSVALGSAIIYWATGLRPDAWRWVGFTAVLWTAYVFVELQTMALMVIIKSSYTAATTSILLTILYLTTASGFLRSYLLLPEWLYYVSFVIFYRYAGAFLNENEFDQNLKQLPTHYDAAHTACPTTNPLTGCVYVNGSHYLAQRYHVTRSESYANDLDLMTNLGICFAFYGGMILINVFLYMIPLPAFVKMKFRQ